MSNPVFLKIKKLHDLPDAGSIKKSTENGRYVVLCFPFKRWPELDKNPIIEKLNESLPDYSVFDSGGDKNWQDPFKPIGPHAPDPLRTEEDGTGFLSSK